MDAYMLFIVPTSDHLNKSNFTHESLSFGHIRKRAALPLDCEMLGVLVDIFNDLGLFVCLG